MPFQLKIDPEAPETYQETELEQLHSTNIVVLLHTRFGLPILFRGYFAIKIVFAVIN